MKVLFISSGNNKVGYINPIITNQAKSISEKGVKIDIFAIKGKGVWGYLRNLKLLKGKIRTNHYDLFHAHYSYSGYLAVLAGAKPLITSLMGSDVTKNKNLLLIRFFIKKFWIESIVKTKKMKDELSLKKKIHVIPNGVDLEKFCPEEKESSRNKLGWDSAKKHILFAANPSRTEKNFQLTYDAFRLLDTSEIVLHTLENIPNDLMPFYYNAADIVILTSHREGSPNVIKEAMACNRPIIATDVGDIKNVIGSTENCFVCDFDADKIAEKINYLLENNIQSTNGRENIQHLSDEVIADKIIAIYKKMLQQV